MNIIRRIILILSISAILIAAVYGFFWLKTQNFSYMDPRNSIPGSFLICVKTNDLINLDESFRKKSEIWKEFKHLKEYNDFERLDKYLEDFDSLRTNNEGFSALFEKDAFISFHKKSEKFEFLASFDCKGINATEELMKIVDNGSLINKFKYENQSCYQVESEKNIIFQHLFFYEYRGIFVVSESLDLLKESIRAINSETKTFKSPAYKRIIETAGTNVLANIYLNFEEISKHTVEIFENDFTVPLIDKLTASVLDLEIYPGKIILNGFTSFDNSKSSPFLKYEDPIQKEKSLNDLFPAGVAFFNEIKGFTNGINKSNISDAEKLFLSRFSELVSSNSAKLISNNAGNYSSYFLISLISGGNMWDFLTAEAVEILGDDYSLEIEEISIGETVFPVAIISSNPIPEIVGFTDDTNYGSFIVYDNTLIFAETLNDINYIIQQNELGNTLSNNRSFQSLEENFASNTNLFSFIDPANYIDVLIKKLKPGPKEFFTKTKNSWSKFDAISFQSTKADDLHYFRIFINFSGVQNEKVNTVWKRNLDTISVHKPAIVRNFNNGEKEIFLQDISRNIYLIGSSGDILWKSKTDGPILSEIIQVDYYNNGKLQYLFNTTKSLYLVDRNGNPVEKFPVEFQTDASAGINLFDYDQSGDWRISVPLCNKSIVMYDRNGRVVSGWKFRTADHLINQALKHTRVGEKDYIIARDDYQLYFLDRKGKKRIKPERQIHFSKKNPIFIEKSTRAKRDKIIASDEKGSVYYFYFDERVEKVFENDLDSDHFFLAEDIVGDHNKEFIFTDRDKLLVYDAEKNLIFSDVLPENINCRPVVYEFSANDKKIGIVATKTGKIYLYNNDGTIYDGFPLNGSSLFSISSFPGLKDRFNLIVSNKDNFLYNYSVK